MYNRNKPQLMNLLKVRMKYPNMRIPLDIPGLVQDMRSICEGVIER